MNAYEDHAIGHYLSDWRLDISYREIITAMQHDLPSTKKIRDYIDPWEPFEGYSLEWLAEHIEVMKESLMRSFDIKDKRG